MRRLTVLDRGSVELDDVFGSDNKVLTAAYASTGNRAGDDPERDERVLRRLATSQPIHWQPFAHPKVSLWIKAPLFVMEQWKTTRIDSLFAADNDAWSQRTWRNKHREQPEFYTPAGWADDQRIAAVEGYGLAWAQYRALIAEGRPPEEARAVLPQALYTSAYWTASLWTIVRWLHEREHEAAQSEIRQYAAAVHAVVAPNFQRCFALFFPHAI